MAIPAEPCGEKNIIFVQTLGGELSEAFYADAVRRVNHLTLAFALYFPAFERLRSTRSLA